MDHGIWGEVDLNPDLSDFTAQVCKHCCKTNLVQIVIAVTRGLSPFSETDWVILKKSNLFLTALEAG